MNETEIGQLEVELNQIYSRRSRALRTIRRTDLYFGILIGIIGNLLVSYWIEFQSLRDVYTLNSLVIPIVVLVIGSTLGGLNYIRTSDSAINRINEFEVTIRRLERRIDELD